ncbi:Peptidoglycan/LPS O-acetylase OafA/YrhL, contains acyltransferase and SGNH-hydrolase domains [Pedococcus dokdonensis]|uniref:Peptidoglycan/LPS O-acetylase OafA/YrhL, contains acyltransferase and SGNH-hydrolase domains n=1 Tax=Pedococcus dokdonensis TaxID=443156 RepID=A0A1H0RAH2_9MICO|nr:acyltransferase [Pedococcus dokdonensis]SDP26563.1 Peptidoglycan/LPS O-acetylase OafA/YrhL, contains acyltransferase and SGNH-hydrolase domains [Pedococcus dokdonensis]
MTATVDTYVLGRRPALDGLRGLAVLAVVAGHSLLPFSGNSGTTGVTVFFTLSGFLITRLLLEEHRATGRVDVRAFYVRRARRLGPALVLFLAVSAVFLALSSADFTPWVASTLQVANFANLARTPMGGLAHMWSLSMEEQFYLVWAPLLALLLARGRRGLLGPVLIGGTVLSVAIRLGLVLGGASSQRIMFGPDSRADALLIGCLVAVYLPHLQSRHTARLAALGAVVLVACLPLGPQGAWTLLPVALATAAVVLWAVTTDATGPAHALLTWRPLTGLGRISYGIYLWHLPFALAFATGRSTWTAAALTLVTSLSLATVSYLLVEKPFLRGRGSSRPTLVVDSPVPRQRYAAHSGSHAARGR